MQERFFRFGIAGLTFLLSVVFGFWYLGGKLSIIINTKNEIIITTIVAIISTPSLGFIISSINKEIWEYIYPKKELFLNPPNIYKKEYLRMIFNAFPEHSGITNIDDTYKIEKLKTVLLNHQVLMRELANKETIDFSARRVDVFYAQINGIYSVISGIIIGFILNFYLYASAVRSFNWIKALFIVLPIVYVYVGCMQANRARNESNEFEKRFLLFKFNKKYPRP